ncbi:MAG: hypothetical protein ABSA57_09065 [Candidatus Acidiferrales bacterium]|jgi:hypothetical protein
MRSVVGLLLTLLIVFGTYKLFFAQLQSTGSAAPTRTIDVAGVKNDLVSIAQSERVYQAEHSTYGTLDQLTSSGAMSMEKKSRDGYTYQAELSASGFRVVAYCPVAANPGCSNYVIDDTMAISTLP